MLVVEFGGHYENYVIIHGTDELSRVGEIGEGGQSFHAKAWRVGDADISFTVKGDHFRVRNDLGKVIVER